MDSDSRGTLEKANETNVTKRCTKCNGTFSLEYFYTNISREDGHSVWCQNCNKEYANQYRERLRELNPTPAMYTVQIPDGHLVCRICNRLLSNDMFYPSDIKNKDIQCKSCKRENGRKRKKSLLSGPPPMGDIFKCKVCEIDLHKEMFSEYEIKIRSFRCKKCVKIQNRRNKQRPEVQERAREYKRLPRIVEKAKIRRQERYKTEPLYRLASRLRSSLGCRINRQKTIKSSKTIKLLGCSLQELLTHIEKLFWPGMTVELYLKTQKIHLDHIIPISAFDLKDPKQQELAFHYTNIQPLWADDNRSKGKRLDWSPLESKHELPERLKNSII